MRAEAAALLDRYPEPGGRPPLFGTLLGVKDIFSAQGLPTGGGTSVPDHVFAMPEATAVRRLRDAGAIVLGKTITTEFAYLEAGATTNPFDQSRSPGGSSSGSAAIVGAGIASLAVGSQTVGSVLRPAAFCGVAGFKPSYGRIPRDGIIPFSKSVDTVGTFSQDVAGTILASQALFDSWTPVADSGPKLPVLGGAGGALPGTGGAGGPGGAGASDQPAARARLQRAPRARPDRYSRDQPSPHGPDRGRLLPRASPLVHGVGRVLPGRQRRSVRRGASHHGVALATAEPSTRWLRADLAAAMDAAGIDAWISPSATGVAPVGLRATGVTLLNLPWDARRDALDQCPGRGCGWYARGFAGWYPASARTSSCWTGRWAWKTLCGERLAARPHAESIRRRSRSAALRGRGRGAVEGSGLTSIAVQTISRLDPRRLGEHWLRQCAVYALPTAATVAWLVYVLSAGELDRLSHHWESAFTMIFGSFLAGSSPEGGGAVAFPVFTKVLEVPAQVARTFSLSIQAVGMTMAALIILLARRPVDPHAVLDLHPRRDRGISGLAVPAGR